MSAESNLKSLREESQAWKQLKAERDELLVALEECMAELAREVGVPIDECIGGPFKKWRAIIAKYKGA